MHYIPANPLKNPSYDYWLSVSRSIYTDDLADKMVIGIYTVYVHNGKVYVMPALTPQWVEFDVNNKLYENIEQLKDYKLNINIETKGKEAIISFDYIKCIEKSFF